MGINGHPIRPKYDPSIISINHSTLKYSKTTKNTKNTHETSKITKIPLKPNKKKPKYPLNLKNDQNTPLNLKNDQNTTNLKKDRKTLET